MSFLDTQEKAKKAGMVVKTFPYPQLYQGLEYPRCSHLLTMGETAQVLERCSESKLLYPVDLQGLSDISDEESVGSHRQTIHDVSLAQYLTHKIWVDNSLNIVPLKLDSYSPVDWQSQNPEQLNYWIPLHVSPVFRYMEYSEGGEHYTHYDAPYIDNTNPLIRTLQSGVLYLTSNDVYTRFIEDGQENIPFVERKLDDWTVPSTKDQINMAFKSERGSVIVFPHQLAHDVSKHPGGEKRIIIRFDIFYQAVGKV